MFTLTNHFVNSQVDIHEDFISSCMDRLKASYDTVTVLEKDKDSTAKLNQELTRLCRVLKVHFLDFLVKIVSPHCPSYAGFARVRDGV